MKTIKFNEETVNYINDCVKSNFYDMNLKMFIDLEDLQQDVIYKIFKSYAKKYDETRANERTYLSRVIKHMCLRTLQNYYREKHYFNNVNNYSSLNSLVATDSKSVELGETLEDKKDNFEEFNNKELFKNLFNSFKDGKKKDVIKDICRGYTDKEIEEKYNIKTRRIYDIKRELKETIKNIQFC